jgi:hypothetical protein
MAAPIPLRPDFNATLLRKLARGSHDPDQIRRLLALAEIYDGGSRSDAARIPFGSGEYNASASDMLLRSIAIPDNRLKTNAIIRGDFDDDACSPLKSMNRIISRGNSLNASFHYDRMLVMSDVRRQFELLLLQPRFRR